MNPAILAAAGVTLVFLSACTSVPSLSAGRSTAVAASGFWLDFASGQSVSDEEVFRDLSTAGVIFVGESHSNARHHEVQLWLLQNLFARRLPLVLCLEQLETRDQPAVDRYLRREIDFDTLAREIAWAEKWGNYADYRPLCEFARQHRIPLRALNAPASIIRAVNRGGGIARLPPDQRAQLPDEIFLDHPVYERVTNLALAAHRTMDSARLRPAFEAQVARDEAMAAGIVLARRIDAQPDQPRTALVIVGAGHMRFGFGTADCVRRRDAGIVERLILMTEGGGLNRAGTSGAVSRDAANSHGDLRAIGRLPADYVRVLPRAAPPPLPPGHPPIP